MEDTALIDSPSRIVEGMNVPKTSEQNSSQKVVESHLFHQNQNKVHNENKISDESKRQGQFKSQESAGESLTRPFIGKRLPRKPQWKNKDNMERQDIEEPFHLRFQKLSKRLKQKSLEGSGNTNQELVPQKIIIKSIDTSEKQKIDSQPKKIPQQNRIPIIGERAKTKPSNNLRNSPSDRKKLKSVDINIKKECNSKKKGTLLSP